MFPLRDENPTLSASWATLVLIALNGAAWFFVQGLGTEPALSSSVCTLGAIAGELLGTFGISVLTFNYPTLDDMFSKLGQSVIEVGRRASAALGYVAE